MRRIAILLVLLAGLVGPLMPRADSAMAVTNCTDNGSWPYFRWTRTDNQVYGVRAPIQIRIDGGLCGVPGGGDNPFNTAGILIQAGSTSTLVGIGIVHDYGISGGHYCRTWENAAGNGGDYDCTTNNDQFVFFKIVRFYDATHHVYKYEIDDCGTSGGYGNNCTAVNSS